MNIIFVLAVTMCIEKSGSQILTHSPDCFSNGNTLTINCETPALNDIISFTLNGGNKGSCRPGLGCGSNITQADTTTSLAIQYNETEHDGSWRCKFGLSLSPVVIIAENPCPISQMSTSIATVRPTSANSVFELSNITIPMTTVSITPTSDILTFTTSSLNTGSKNVNAHTESSYFSSKTETTHFYERTETTISYANTEANILNTNIETTYFYGNTGTTNVDANTKIIGIQSITWRIVTTTAIDISGSLDTTSRNMNETFALPSNSVPSHSKIILPSVFETSNVFPSSFSVTAVFHNLQFSSVSLITADSPIYSILSMTISSLMSTTLIDQISYSSKMEDPSLSSYQYLSETNTLITYYLNDKSTSFVDFSDVFQTFSRDYAALASTSLFYLIQSTDHQSSLQPSENHATMQKEFTSLATTSSYESPTAESSTEIYSQEIMSSGKYYMLTSVMPFQTQLVSMNDIPDSTTPLQSTYLELNFQPTDGVYSSEVSVYLLSTLQPTSVIMPFNTIVNSTQIDSYMTATNSLTSESQSGILTMDLSLFTNHSSIQISTGLSDFETKWYSTTINYDSKDMSSMIIPPSQRPNSDNSYNEIGTSFKDMSSFINSFSESVTTRELLMPTLSSEVIESISTLSTSTIQSGLSEKNKNVIFITTTSAVVTIIVVFLLMIFAKLYMSKYNLKHPKEGDNISWSNKSIPPKAAFPDYSFIGKSIYPRLNTSSTSFKMHPYEHNWNAIV